MLHIDFSCACLGLVVATLVPALGPAPPEGENYEEQRMLLRITRHGPKSERRIAWPDPESGSTVIGPEVGRGDLGEDDEDQRLEQHRRSGLLCRYAEGDAEDPVVILVHGLNGAPSDMQGLADALVEQGVQPWFFLYHDRPRFLDRTGVVLAAGLIELAEQDRDHLVIAAHSMGGVVARCAMNFLEATDWFHDPVGDVQDPGTLLPPEPTLPSRVALLAIDTPWHGFTGWGTTRALFHPREDSPMDMIATGFVFDPLFRTPAVPDHPTSWVEAGTHDVQANPFWTRGLRELSDTEVEAVVEYLAECREEGCRSWEQGWSDLWALGRSPEFRDWRPALELRAAAGELTAGDLAGELGRLEASWPESLGTFPSLDGPELEAALDVMAWSGRLQPDGLLQSWELLGTMELIPAFLERQDDLAAMAVAGTLEPEQLREELRRAVLGQMETGGNLQPLLDEIDLLTEDDLQGLVTCLSMLGSRQLPPHSWWQVRNYVEAMTLIGEFSALRPGLERRAAAGELGVEELREVLAGIVPGLEGDHETILEHPDLPGLVMEMVED